MFWLLLTVGVIAYWAAIFALACLIGRMFAGPRERVSAPPASPRSRFIATRDNTGVVVFLPDSEEDR